MHLLKRATKSTDFARVYNLDAGFLANAPLKSMKQIRKYLLAEMERASVISL